MHQRHDRHARRVEHRADEVELAEVGRVELGDGRRGVAALGPADHAELSAGAGVDVTRGPRDEDAVAPVRRPDGVLVHAGRAEPLVVGRAHDPAGVDHRLQAGHAVIDLPRGAGREVAGQLARRVGLRRRARGVAEAGRAVAPRDDRAIRAGGRGGDDEAGRLLIALGHVARQVAHAPGAGSRDRGVDGLVVDQVSGLHGLDCSDVPTPRRGG